MNRFDEISVESKFCNIAEEIQNIVTDESSNKLSQTAPLGKFLQAPDITVSKIITNIKGADCESTDPRYGKTIGYTAAEVSILASGLDDFLFTIEEWVLPEPNTKDENNYWDWYPFKSTIEAYIDCEKTKYNIVIKIDREKITIKKLNENNKITQYDKKLILEIKNKFKFVSGFAVLTEMAL